MNFTAQIAKHIRDVHFGGNWTDVNLKDSLTGLTWQQAVAKPGAFNSIAALVFHMNYFISAVLKVLEGGPLEAHDKFSFDLPPIRSQQDWEAMTEKSWRDAENFAALVEQLQDSKLAEFFVEEKYGTWYKNLQGIVEHTHYHLGQAVLIKKLLVEADA